MPVNETTSVIDRCASLTWIPLGVRDDESCSNSESNYGFVADEVGESVSFIYIYILFLLFNYAHLVLGKTLIR